MSIKIILVCHGKFLGKPEVSDLILSIVDENIVGFKVSMDDSLFVALAHAVNDLL